MFARRRYARLGIGLAIAALMSLALVLPAMAATTGDTTASADVQAGSLAVTVPATVDLSNVSLDGTDQTPTTTLGINVNDFTGSGLGWTVQLSATQFTDTATDMLAADAMTVQSVSETTTPLGAYVDPVSDTSGYPITLGTTGATIYQANASTGIGGTFDVVPSLQVAVPATTLAGTYTSTITVTVAQGPSA